MGSSGWKAAGEVPSVTPRRRGKVLECAILDAALEQLGTVGWSGLTMEGVAAGAQTGKAAVYRRWPSKVDLVADALRSSMPSLDGAPDCGGVREDLFQLCRAIRDTFFSRPGLALRSVLHECDSATAERFHAVIMGQVVEPSVRLIRAVVERGVARGEVRGDAIDDMVFEVIPGLMMYRSKVCGSEWGDREIAEMVDRVMVPLLRSCGAARGVAGGGRATGGAEP
ncbi:TetR/AcrR family transcriptional regulator [Streptomyces qinzhouensis]|uniref:TetR/AcrR family transcriptional regulator n=1 Tax=Streptomyces qinzhouensis TaxID=2599401 RepID=A0A5B8JP09_9ACTN|nr:TetR/AcrR family transcriptional regulator [Streptomyces qinzhouensis]QDY79393.1 TetR/AcrR family transcriptional regulator [Streptomyces qinzhouensis]